MKWTFDIEANALYVSLTDDATDRQIDLSGGVVVDVSLNGTPTGVEILNPHPVRALVELERVGVAPDAAANIRFLVTKAFLHTGVEYIRATGRTGPETVKSEEDPFEHVLDVEPIFA
jgi:uncharacterized protein YuzE